MSRQYQRLDFFLRDLDEIFESERHNAGAGRDQSPVEGLLKVSLGHGNGGWIGGGRVGRGVTTSCLGYRVHDVLSVEATSYKCFEKVR
jgi:hypothetical protein